MAIGELLGGAVQLFGSWCMFGGGAVVVTTTGIGAIIGAPALAASVGLAGAGIDRTGYCLPWSTVLPLTGVISCSGVFEPFLSP